MDNNKKREYNRLYYYKRDPEKLKQYRKKYQLKKKKTKYERERRWKLGICKPRVILTLTLTPEERQIRRKENKKKYSKEWYGKHREELLAKMNFEYRAKKIKQFVDSILSKNDSERSN